jgi:hypothetical protein
MEKKSKNCQRLLLVQTFMAHYIEDNSARWYNSVHITMSSSVQILFLFFICLIIIYFVFFNDFLDEFLGLLNSEKRIFTKKNPSFCRCRLSNNVVRDITFLLFNLYTSPFQVGMIHGACCFFSLFEELLRVAPESGAKFGLFYSF